MFKAACGSSFLMLGLFQKLVSRATKSTSVKLFMKRELVLLRISCAKEFPAPFQTVP